MPQMLPEYLSTSIFMCVRAVKALARLRVCANASGALDDQIFEKCQKSQESYNAAIFF